MSAYFVGSKTSPSLGTKPFFSSTTLALSSLNSACTTSYVFSGELVMMEPRSRSLTSYRADADEALFPCLHVLAFFSLMYSSILVLLRS